MEACRTLQLSLLAAFPLRDVTDVVGASLVAKAHGRGSRRRRSVPHPGIRRAGHRRQMESPVVVDNRSRPAAGAAYYEPDAPGVCPAQAPVCVRMIHNHAFTGRTTWQGVKRCDVEGT